MPDLPKTFKDEVERWVFVEMQEIKRGPLEGLEANRPALKAVMNRHFTILEDMLSDHKFLIADEPSLADFAVFGALTPLSYSGNPIPQEFKALSSWSRNVNAI